MAIDLAHEPPFRIGAVEVEPGSRILRGEGGEERIEPRVMQVLIALAHARGSFLSRNDLRDLCWDGRLTSDDAIDRVIAQIRRLADGVGGGAFRLETVAKVGYRLTVERGPCAGQSKAQPAVPAKGSALRVSRRAAATGVTGAILAAIGGFALERGWSGRLRARPPSGSPAESRAGPLTLAVEPHSAIGGDSAARQIALLLAGAVQDRLSPTSGLRLVARGAGGSGDPQAAYLLQGSIARWPGGFQVNTRLVDNASGAIVWTDTQTAAGDRPDRLKHGVAGAVAQQIAGWIGPEQLAGTAPRRTGDPAAFRRSQKARVLIENSRDLRMIGDEGGAERAAARAQALAQEALAIDPEDPGALIVMAQLTRNGWAMAQGRKSTARQQAAASLDFIRSALLADPNDPAALAALGDHYRRTEWRWTEAQNLLRRALALDPDLIDAHWSYAYFLGTHGRAVEGLSHARRVAAMRPRSAWHRLALPRLLYVTGRRQEAMGHYARELARVPGSAFLVRELYFMHLAEGNRPALLALVETLSRLWTAKMPPAIARLSERASAGAEALAGRPAKLISMVDSDLAAYDSPPLGPKATQQGRASVDLLYIYAMEYAWAGQTAGALDLLERALNARSLYWPATLPFGQTEFPRAVRDHPRYEALWRSDDALRQLVRNRLRGVRSGQMAGVLPDGRRVRPRRV